MSHTSGNIILHLVFSTVGRRPLTTPVFRDDLFALYWEGSCGVQATALIVNGTADHVHILVRVRPTQSAAELARVIKANSSGWVRMKVGLRPCMANRICRIQRQRIKCRRRNKYIANQEEHHRKHSFQEEFVAFLKKNNVACDEKYVWG